MKSELAFQMISEDKNNLLEVDYRKFNKQYMERDSKARNRMRELIDSERNRVEKVFSTLV